MKATAYKSSLQLFERKCRRQDSQNCAGAKPAFRDCVLEKDTCTLCCQRMLYGHSLLHLFSFDQTSAQAMNEEASLFDKHQRQVGSLHQSC